MRKEIADWRCSGCGAVWPDGKSEHCRCPTDVLYTRDIPGTNRIKSAWMMEERPAWIEPTANMLTALGDLRFAAGVLFGVAVVIIGIHVDLVVDGRADWLNGYIEHVRTE